MEHFGAQLPADSLAVLQAQTTRVIACLEIVPVALALEAWAERTRHRRVFVFVDNDAARASLIKMSTNVDSMKIALLRVAALKRATPSFLWFARVPSSSNPGDAPSRLEDLEVDRPGAKKIEVSLSWLERRRTPLSRTV